MEETCLNPARRTGFPEGALRHWRGCIRALPCGPATEVSSFHFYKRINQTEKLKTKTVFLQLKIWVFSSYVPFYLFGSPSSQTQTNGVTLRTPEASHWCPVKRSFLAQQKGMDGWGKDGWGKFLICTGPRQWIFRRCLPYPGKEIFREIGSGKGEARGSSSYNHLSCKQWICWDCPGIVSFGYSQSCNEKLQQTNFIFR